MSLANILTPLAGELSIGGIGGFLVGYALKKVAKIVTVFLGLIFLGLQYLAYKGYISIQYDALKESVKSFVFKAPAGGSGFIYDVIAHVPFGVAFIGGFYLGFKKG